MVYGCLPYVSSQVRSMIFAVEVGIVWHLCKPVVRDINANTSESERPLSVLLVSSLDIGASHLHS